MNLDYGAASIRDHGRSRTVTYTEIRRPTTKRGACPVCGKRRTRTNTFTATVNPFNRDPDTSQPRTPAQVRAVLAAKAEAWEPDFACAGHTDAEVCAAVGHKPSVWAPTSCARCRVEIPEETS